MNGNINLRPGLLHVRSIFLTFIMLSISVLNSTTFSQKLESDGAECKEYHSFLDGAPVHTMHQCSEKAQFILSNFQKTGKYGRIAEFNLHQFQPEELVSWYIAAWLMNQDLYFRDGFDRRIFSIAAIMPARLVTQFNGSNVEIRLPIYMSTYYFYQAMFMDSISEFEISTKLNGFWADLYEQAVDQLGGQASNVPIVPLLKCFVALDNGAIDPSQLVRSRRFAECSSGGSG